MTTSMTYSACIRRWILAATIWLIPFGVLNANESSGPSAQEVLAATGIQGGLVVHLGCGDGQLTAALGAEENFLVQGLDADPADVEAARRHVHATGLYGRVSVDRLDGSLLPYVDNLVNLVVAEDLGTVSMDEVLRVLCPGGVAYIKTGGQWTKTVKPRPAEIDDWTHFLHDPTNNAVSDDSVVGPPRQLQWVGGPAWARSHDHLASLSAAVVSGGRIFSIVDEGPIAAVVLQPKWQLVARDAFSGVVLWKRPIRDWQWHLRAFRTGPSELARRLVAVGDRVYVTLGIDAPLSALEAATGKTLATYEGTASTLEVLCHQGTLYVVAGDVATQQAAAKARRRGQRPGFAEVRPQRPAYAELPPAKRIMAIDAASGRVLWKKADDETRELMPTTLALGGSRLFFQNADEVLCLDAHSGETIWQTQRTVSRNRPTWSAPTLVVYRDVVLSADRAVAEKPVDVADDQRKVQWFVSAAGGQAPVGELIAFSAETGQRLWSCPAKECYNSPIDVLVADGLVWTGQLVRANEPGITEGRDPKTGEVRRTRPKDQEFFSCGMGHGRCYRNKATCKYLVLGRSGVEFIDVSTGKPVPNHWTRGTCQYGVIPCNGLLYVPPHTCACFTRSKLNGYLCLAPRRGERRAARGERGGEREEGGEKSEEGLVARLERGPAFDAVASHPSPLAPRPSSDWPTYRHDPSRSGRTPDAVSTELQEGWKTELGGRLSSVVVAEGKVLVARIDAHTVHALGADDGRPLWSFTASGRVDSPPTLWQGRVLFGSADGWVYCLRGSDGKLAWRFRAAPQERRIVAYGQLESAWPVSGSVLVQNGTVYCAAGRSSYLDGSIRICRLDAKTGRLLSETTIDHRDPETGFQRKGTVKGTNMPGALPDVLSCDGESVYMRHLRFDLKGQPQPSDVPHLYSGAGFLDDAWWHRTYWMMGTMMGTNYGGWPRSGNQVPAGRLLAVDQDAIYGFGRSQYIHHGAHVGIDGATIFHFNPGRDAQRRQTYYRAFAVDRRPAARGKTYRWTQDLPILVRAMLLAGDRLLMAGPPDFFAADDPAAAWEGRQGGTLMVLSPTDGRKLAEYPLENPPVHDGMASAAGRLYLSTTGGQVVCFREKP